ncbi:toxin-antitoxin system YwqK family antitoxin [Pseudanabaena sp. 'Roaring Creek']|uniref:toxin-antitoxin system YwqK family antitoxin n=1 Tax=Pseudanabaena sp. 'Roaring Creek' TaxID=1681830 RepID=UPI0006D84226|nr:hypothetical protein [Pseudanabaena sp. 'Roaring Creek']
MKVLLRVDYDLLEPSDDFLIEFYEGIPFTGIAYENHLNGSLLSETPFTNGYKNGIEREWSESGILIEEVNLEDNQANGLLHKWHCNGQLKCEGMFEMGVCLWMKEWDETGNLTRDYVIDEKSSDFIFLRGQRKLRVNK